MNKLLKIIFLSVLLLWAGFAYATPVISPQKAIVGVTFARVIWTSTEASTSRVDYGATVSYGSNETDGSSVTWHVITITSLTANTTYHYKITSGVTESSDYTFTTYANPTGTVRTVDDSGGKDYTTIQACVNAMSAGDTCLVYAGTYNETVTVGSGTSGNYKTILAQEPAIVDEFIFGGKSYSAVKGFEISDGTESATASTYILLENNYINSSADACVDSDESNALDWWIVKDNVLYQCGYVGVRISGSNILIDSNDISHQVNDCIYDGGLTNSVIRNNVCHDYDPSGSGQHLDFIQWDDGGTVVAFTESLIEGNTILRCTDSTHNCHVVILRNPGPGTSAEHPIIRYNFASHIDGAGFMMGGGATDSIPYSRIYNNTVATEYKIAESSSFSTFYIGNYEKSLNNLAYNTGDSDYSPFDLPGTGGVNNYNVAYDSTDTTSATWDSPYTGEATFDSLKNLNPTFINYPYEAIIAPNSPLINIGGALTTVAAGDSGSGTTLVVNDARWFQPGWAGTDADWIAVGTVLNIIQIASINYGTDTITLTSGITRSEGQSVWLYKKSDGVRVLYGAAPDIGAYEIGISAALTGTLSDNANESDVVTGGQTLIYTLSGGETWIADIAGENANSAALLATLDSGGEEGTGWDAIVKADLIYSDITRDSDTQITITLRARPTFSITANETITVGAIPAGCVTGGVAIDVNDSFDIINDASIPGTGSISSGTGTITSGTGTITGN